MPSLRALVERAVTVEDLLAAPLWSVDRDDAASDAAAEMAARDFDVAGVAGEPVTHYVTRQELERSEGKVSVVARPILAADTIEKRAPLATFIEVLRRRPHVFVLDIDRVRAVVTRADLQAPAVGVVTLAFLVAMESASQVLVPQCLGSGWFELLSEEARANALRIFGTKQGHNVATGLEDCLYFSDWINLTGKCSDLLRELGFPSASKFQDATGAFVELRNSLAHGGTILDTHEPERAIELFREIRRITDRLWDLVQSLGPLWDRHVETIIKAGDPPVPLTGPTAADLLWPPPLHVLTAWNPEGLTRPVDLNRAANQELAQLLESHGYRPMPAVGSSPDGRWHEESFLVSGMARDHAVGLGQRFGQGSVLELTDEELLVLRSEDGSVVRRGPRVTMPGTSPLGVEVKPTRRREVVRRRVEDLTAGFARYADAYDRLVPFSAEQLAAHRRTLELRRESGSVAAALLNEEFLASLHATLVAWGLGTRASYLAPESRFAEALRTVASDIEELEALFIDDPSLPDDAPERIWRLIELLEIVENKAKIVAGTKTLHHLLPELVVPMDRMWTGRFFQLHAPEWQGIAASQRAVFVRTYRSLVTVARAVRPQDYATGEGWRTSRTKVIDNALIGYCQLELGKG